MLKLCVIFNTYRMLSIVLMLGVIVLGFSPTCGAQDDKGIEGKLKRIGWNALVKQRFMHPPTFHFEPLDDATSYRCTISWQEGNLSQACVVQSKTPNIALADTWKKLPPAGNLYVSAEAIAAGGKSIGKTNFSFTKIAPFTGPYRPAKSGYMESGTKAALWVLQQAKDEKAGRYPALFASAYIRVLTTYARLYPKSESAKAALEAAKKHGETLLKGSTPADWVYANMPMSHNNNRALQVGR